MSQPPAIEAVDVSKSFRGTRAVAKATIAVERGQLVAIVGPSGSGKTTLLRILAGFEAPDEGTVAIAGRTVAGPGVWEEPERRRVGMVFQDGALFPHLTVARNVEFGNPRPGRVEECLALVGLAHRAASYPHELSGGERQRVALARALAPEPEVVLLDEPFASLDTGLRVSLREEVASILREAGASALLITHDQQEALSLADVVAVMRDGAIEQVGEPEAVYARPTSRWVAEFLGDAHVMPGTSAGGLVTCELGTVSAPDAPPGVVDVVIRPESLTLTTAPGAGTNGVARARVVARAYYGHEQLTTLELASGRRLRSRTVGTADWHVGDEVHVAVTGPVSVLAPSVAPGVEAQDSH